MYMLSNIVQELSNDMGSSVCPGRAWTRTWRTRNWRRLRRARCRKWARRRADGAAKEAGVVGEVVAVAGVAEVGAVEAGVGAVAAGAVAAAGGGEGAGVAVGAAKRTEALGNTTRIEALVLYMLYSDVACFIQMSTTSVFGTRSVAAGNAHVAGRLGRRSEVCACIWAGKGHGRSACSRELVCQRRELARGAGGSHTYLSGFGINFKYHLATQTNTCPCAH